MLIYGVMILRIKCWKKEDNGSERPFSKVNLKTCLKMPKNIMTKIM